MSGITINAILKAKPGKEEALFEVLQEVVEPSRKEPGCLEYILHRSVEDSRTFVFYETWKDIESIEAHIQSSHYKEYRCKAEDLYETRKVLKLKKY